MTDDDDIIEPLSSRRALERADHGKQERKEKIQQKKSLFGLLRSVLRRDLFIHAGKINEETKRQRSQTFKTLTHKEEEEQRVQKASMKQTPDRLVEESIDQEVVEAAAQYEEEKRSDG